MPAMILFMVVEASTFSTSLRPYILHAQIFLKIRLQLKISLLPD